MGQDGVYTLHPVLGKVKSCYYVRRAFLYSGHSTTPSFSNQHQLLSPPHPHHSPSHLPTTPSQPLSPPQTDHSPSHLHTPTTAPLTSTLPHLKTLKESVQLLWGEVPRQLGQQVVNVLDDGLVLALLTGPDLVQVLNGQDLLSDAEPQHLLQFLHVLWLVEVVPQHHLQDIVLFDPRLCVWCVCGVCVGMWACVCGEVCA